MKNQLELINSWLELNRLIRNIKLLIVKYPGDATLRIELQELEKKESILKKKSDALKAKVKEIQEDKKDSREILTW